MITVRDKLDESFNWGFRMRGSIVIIMENALKIFVENEKSQANEHGNLKELFW